MLNIFSCCSFLGWYVVLVVRTIMKRQDHDHQQSPCWVTLFVSVGGWLGPTCVALNKHVLSLQSCGRWIFSELTGKYCLCLAPSPLSSICSQCCWPELHSQGKQMAFKHWLITALPSLWFPAVVHFSFLAWSHFCPFLFFLAKCEKHSCLLLNLFGHRLRIAGGWHHFLAHLKATLML